MTLYTFSDVWCLWGQETEIVSVGTCRKVSYIIVMFVFAVPFWFSPILDCQSG